VTHSADETAALAEAVGSLLRAGDFVALAGELGAGKTVFVKGLARALGVTEPVVSPTFTIMREYSGRLPLAHVDVYRLGQLQELHDLGFDELVGGPGVTVVEWGDRIGALLPAARLDVSLQAGAGPDAPDDDRVVTIHPCGAAWLVRADALAAVVDGDSFEGRDIGSGGG
jgi:tRNA threonylcarbamoyladenosine biosynthesis protein TsaE